MSSLLFRTTRLSSLTQQLNLSWSFLKQKKLVLSHVQSSSAPFHSLCWARPTEGKKWEPIDKLDELLPLYGDLLVKLKEAGAETVQIDEPVLVFDLHSKAKAAFKPAYEKLSALGSKGPPDRPSNLFW